MSRPSVEVRELTAADAGAAVELLRLRDGRQHDAAAVVKVLCDLEPARLRAWGAFVDGRPAGMTTLYLRPLRGWAAEPVRAGYWAHLYVRPEFRPLMLYPLLVRAMRQGARAAGCDLIYTATRRPRVVEGHRRLDFELVGKLPFSFKPLRPFRLIAKQSGLGGAGSRLAVLGDGPYLACLRLAARRRSASGVRELEPTGGDVDSVVELMNEARRDGIGQAWNADAFRRRFTTTIEGGAYTLLGAPAGAGLEAALISCLATREEGIRLGVLIEAVSRPGREEMLGPLFDEAERRLMDGGCEVVLRLAGTDLRAAGRVPKRGYRVARHVYHLLVWSPDPAWKQDRRHDLASWHFALSDHDAF